jgi:restriction system protein
MARTSGPSDWQRRLAAERRAAEKAATQAARDDERRRKEEMRLQREAYLRQQLDEAARRNETAAQRIDELTHVLPAALRTPPQQLDFHRLKKAPVVVPMYLGVDASPIRAPQWEDFAPPQPGPLAGFFGGKARYERERAAAEAAMAVEVERHKAAETARQQRVVAARRRQAEEQAKVDAEVRRQHAKVDAFAQAVKEHDRHAVSQYFQLLIDQVGDPPGFPDRRRAGYVPESTLLALEWQLPGVDIVPTQKTYRYVKARDAIESSPRAVSEIRQIYQKLVAQIALRALHTIFSSDAFGLVGTIVFNGVVKAIDPTTGQRIEPCLITLRATRSQYAPLVLADVDAVACVRKYFAADVSQHPDELQAVQPVMEFKMADPRIIDPVDIISGIDKRPNLLELTPKEFEHFVHNLFDRMGLDTKLFRADGDGGVDCIAYDPKPIFGGKFVVQAKLYTKTVPPAAVRDLFGTIQHEGATKGILITTSGFGPSSYEFASGKPLQLIDGSGLLALCNDLDIPARIVPGRGRAR